MKGDRSSRPSVDDPAVVEQLCAEIATGLSISKACEKLDVSRYYFYVRMGKDEEFRVLIARAREAQAAALVDEMVEMADRATPEDWQVVRLQIWTRQWYAGKCAPRSYGDKIQHANAAGDGNAVFQILTGVPRDDQTD